MFIHFLNIFRLLTPPGTPLFPSLEMESQKTVMGQLGTPKARPLALKSRVRGMKMFIHLYRYCFFEGLNFYESNVARNMI